MPSGPFLVLLTLYLMSGSKSLSNTFIVLNLNEMQKDDVNKIIIRKMST